MMLYEVKLTFDFDRKELVGVSGTVCWPDTQQPEHVHVWSELDARTTSPQFALALEGRNCRDWIRARGEQLALALDEADASPVSADRRAQELEEKF